MKGASIMKKREPKIYGYARISTPKQSLQRQIDNIKASFPNALIYQEVFTGKSSAEDREKFTALLKVVKPGDSIVFDEVSRLSRDAQGGYETYMNLIDRGVKLHFIKEPHLDSDVFKAALDRQINVQIETGSSATDTFTGGLFDLLNQYMRDLAREQIRLAFERSEAEAAYLRKRTKEGIAAKREAAIAAGKDFKIGRAAHSTIRTAKQKMIAENIRNFSKDFTGGKNNTMNDVQVMNQINGSSKKTLCSRPTYYAVKKMLQDGTFEA